MKRKEGHHSEECQIRTHQTWVKKNEVGAGYHSRYTKAVVIPKVWLLRYS